MYFPKVIRRTRLERYTVKGVKYEGGGILSHIFYENVGTFEDSCIVPHKLSLILSLRISTIDLQFSIKLQGKSLIGYLGKALVFIRS